jgi:endo-1,4-beta-D-glucanase Y
MRGSARVQKLGGTRALRTRFAAALPLVVFAACSMEPNHRSVVAGGGAPIVAPGTAAASGGVNTPPPSSGGFGGAPSRSTSGAAGASSGGFAGAPGAAVDAGPSRGPTPARSGVKFPFPQNREGARCVYPRGYRNERVEAAYVKWKADTVTANGAGGHLRVQRPNEPGLAPNSTVSEGIGYGMLAAVYMGDQMLFDELWKYEQLWLDDNGLMDWYIDAAGTQRLGTGAATDADEDMAFALVMADRQWGGQGSLDRPYIEHAKGQIQRLVDHEIFEGKLPRAGDHWGDWNNVNISYFAPSYYRVFAQVNGNQSLWDAVLKTVYDTIDNVLNAKNGNQDNGLVPAWCTSEGVPGNPPQYQYDACRTPFRIGLDWCMFGEMRARDYVAKTSRFFSAQGADGIADGYELDGTPHPQSPGAHSAAFIGPAAVGAMSDAAYRQFVDDAYSSLASSSLLAGGAYYEESWTVLSLLMLTGNFLDYTAL